MTDSVAAGSLLQRMRVIYRQGDDLRFLSHLDLVRVFERALRRAGLPTAYSQGFNARPRLTFAAPLPVGFSGEREMVDILLSEPIEPHSFMRRLEKQMPPGLALRETLLVPRKSPSLPALLLSAGYLIHVPGRAIQDMHGRVIDLLGLSSLPRRRRRRKKGEVEYDLRPLIESLEVREDAAGCKLQMQLSARPGATGRPEEILAALGYAEEPAQIVRVALILAHPDSSTP